MFSRTDVLGNTLKVSHFYGDGSFDCPHCNNAVRADEGFGPCRNPWCTANPAMPVESAQAIVNKRAAQLKEQKDRERNHKWAMERIEQGRIEREERTRAAHARAQTEGFCWTCHYKSDYRKEVTHRKACPYESHR